MKLKMPGIRRQMAFLDFTLSLLLRRKGKYGALITVYTLIIFVLASVMFYTGAIKKEASILLQDAPQIIVQQILAGRQVPVSAGSVGRIRELRGVSSAAGRLWGYYYDTIFHANYTVMAPGNFQHGPGDIVIGSGVSRAAVSQEDNILPFWTYNGSFLSLRVAEVLPPESELVASDLILMPAGAFRQLFGMSDSLYTDIVVSVDNATDVPAIAGEIQKQVPGARTITRDEILRTYDATFSWSGGIMLLLLSGTALAMLILAWDKASGLSAGEKKEIGVLKATGWETSDVVLIRFWEGAVVSLSSFFSGVLLAYVHVFIASAALFAPVLKGWSVLYPEPGLVPFIDGYQVAMLFLLTVVPYTVAAIIPSWRVAREDPDAVIRG